MLIPIVFSQKLFFRAKKKSTNPVRAPTNVVFTAINVVRMVYGRCCPISMINYLTIMCLHTEKKK